MKSRYIKKADLIFIVGGILTAIVLYILFNSFSEKGNTVIVKQGSDVIKTVNLDTLSEPYVIEFDGEYPCTVTIDKDGAYFSKAECPDKVCLKTGKISRTGQTAVCLPAKVSLIVTGSDAEQYDAVTG